MTRPARWYGGIHTAAGLQKINCRFVRRGVSVKRALTAMKNGAALLMFYERGRPTWKLTTGAFVSPEVAAVIISKPSVAGVGDCLFGGAASQTYRWINQEGTQ